MSNLNEEIKELESFIKELENISKDRIVDVSDEIRETKEKLLKLREKAYSNLTAWDKVEIARNPLRPTALDYIDIIFDDFIELHGDRQFKDDKSIVCGLAKIEDQNFTIVAEQKGRNTKENIERNFGMPNPESYEASRKVPETYNYFYRYKGSVSWNWSRRKRPRRSYC